MDFDDCIKEDKEHILNKDCWDVYDSSFMMTDFDVEDCNNGENEIRRRKISELIQASIHSKKLIPDFNKNHFKPKTIINWGIEKKILREGAFAGLIAETKDEEVEADISNINGKRLKSLKKYMNMLEEMAIKNGVAFDKKRLLCSKGMMLKWLQERTHSPRNLFDIKQATFNSFWSKVAKGYKLCPSASVEKDFFEKIMNG